MAAVVGITLVKEFAYRGDPLEEYSNQYWLTGAVLPTPADWKYVVDILITLEKTIYPSSVSVVRAYGYASDDPEAASVWGFDYKAVGQSVPGTLTPGAGIQTPGDCAVWVRWKTERLNSKGKPIYLRKYFHPAMATSSSGAGADTVLTAQKSALTNFAAALKDPAGALGRTLRSQTHAEVLGAHACSQFVTTRTLKRRGKRPGS